MSKYASITQEYLKSILDYNPDTGIFVWRERLVEHFKNGKQTKEHNCNAWNAKNAGKQTGSQNKNGYLLIWVNYKVYPAHILAYIYMTGKQPDKKIDHKNGNKKDNRWINLRLATDFQNAANSKISKANTSGYKGVTFNKQKNKYAAQIKINYKTIYLGYYKTPEEAHAAYCAAATKYHGEFARTE
jgi:hypothetical protein